MSTEIAELLKMGQMLYEVGNWQESDKIADQVLSTTSEKEEVAEASLQKGWNRYYLGIKGPAEQKKENLQISEQAFWDAVAKTEDPKKKLSAVNGLPLVIWILGDKEKAWFVSAQVIEEFGEEPSAWNTRGILCRWAKDFKQAVEVGENVYKTALAKEDYRTAGNGKQNKADAFMELDRLNEAKEEYQMAEELYKKYEEVTGKSAEFHVRSVQQKLVKIVQRRRALES